MFGGVGMGIALQRSYKIGYTNNIIRDQDSSSDYTTSSVKLDQIMKKLFTLSHQATLYMVNSLFDENLTLDEVTIHPSNGEFINDTYERLFGDIYLTIETKLEKITYHIELQTLHDASMALRMFRYGFEKGLELSKLGKRKNLIVFPKQVVLFLEQNEAIEDPLSLTVQLPNGTTFDYTVPVIKYWRYTEEDLVKQKMYALLPLQVFQYRKAMRAIENSTRTTAEKNRLMSYEFQKLEQTIRRMIQALEQLDQELSIQELSDILAAQKNLTAYLYGRYGEYKKYEKEVQEMVESYIDRIPRIFEEGRKAGEEEGKQEIAKRLLTKGMPVSEVAEITDISEEEIKQWLS